MRHDLKIRPEFFRDVADGRKNFELRYDDRWNGALKLDLPAGT